MVNSTFGRPQKSPEIWQLQSDSNRMKDSSHFGDMLNERGIESEWADRAVKTPDHKEDHDDGTVHFIKQIPEFGNRWLRVIVNVTDDPKIRITTFFDRRLRRKYESKS